MEEMLGKMKSWVSLLPPFTITNVVEILILAVFVYECLLWIKNTKAWELLKGILVIVAFTAFAAIFHMTTIMWLIERLSTAAIIAAVVIFQPELRKALEQLGSKSFISNLLPDSNAVDTSFVTANEIANAAFEMAKKKTGALIVIQQKQSLREIENTGIRINGIVSAALLINIFEKNTPLHDGAVVIVGDKVTSATCYLPLSDTEISKDFGTRHRAALGVSENTDSITVVVSEETGRVSVADKGRLIRIPDRETLLSCLPNELAEEAERDNRNLFPLKLFKRGKENEQT